MEGTEEESSPRQPTSDGDFADFNRSRRFSLAAEFTGDRTAALEEPEDIDLIVQRRDQKPLIVI